MSRPGIIDLRSYQRNARGTLVMRREALTVILSVANIQHDAEVHRHIGVSDALTFAELKDILAVVFALPDEDAPWHFRQISGGIDGGATSRGKRIDPKHRLAEFLWEEEDRVELWWGLLVFDITVVEVYPRDDGTPQALCVGGSGSFPGCSFDLTAINTELTGQDVIAEVLTQIRPTLRSVIERSRLLDFVPLLQALDVGKAGNVEKTVGKDIATTLATLPREVTEEGTDSFWSVVLGLICLGGSELEDQVIETTMEALGWRHESGRELTAHEIRAKCQASLDELAAMGVMGPCACAPVYRLEILRALVSGVG